MDAIKVLLALAIMAFAGLILILSMGALLSYFIDLIFDYKIYIDQWTCALIVFSTICCLFTWFAHDKNIRKAS